MKQILNAKIKQFFNLFGYNLSKINKETKSLNFDEIIRKKIYNKPLIFDVGANQGQSILKYLKLMEDPIIHAFEPIDFEYDKLKIKFFNNKNIFLNNFAMGDIIENKEFNISIRTGNSSFNKITENTKWLETRSKQYNVSKDSYIQQKKIVKIDTIDNYVKENNIETIDLLKIDTQGYEDKILKGASKSLEQKKIKIIISEIIFDNTYEKYLTFSDIEKYLIKNNYRMVGLDVSSNNIFSGLTFFADVMYFRNDLL